MSITVGLWNDAEIEAVKTDKWLATLLMNAGNLDKKMAAAYPYDKRRTYIAEWDDDPSVTIYATDERMLKRFIDAEYIRRPDYLTQKITQYRPIDPQS